MTMKNIQWCVILNPVSGRGRALKDKDKIDFILKKHGLNCKIYISEYHGHTLDITAKAISSGFRKFIAVGGDGTLNEIVNGIFSQKKIAINQFLLAAIPVGTGNDWAKNNLPGKTYEIAVKMIQEDISCLQDVGLLTYSQNQKKIRRYFINFAGIGFDSAVVYNMASRKFGALSYFFAILKTFLYYKGTDMTVSIDGRTLDRNVFVLMAAIGKFCGGGMHLAPESLPDDGFFDVTLVNSLSRLHILASLPAIYNGKILGHPSVESFRCKKIKVESKADIRIESDGELLGNPPVTYEIRKKALRVIGQAKIH